MADEKNQDHPQDFRKQLAEIASSYRKEAQKVHWKDDAGWFNTVLYGRSIKSPKAARFYSKGERKAFEKRALKGISAEAEEAEVCCAAGSSIWKVPQKRTREERMQGVSGLQKMLDCCGPVRANKREVAKLVLAVLAGMTSRQIINKCSDDEIDPDDKRAPLIVVGKREGRWDALRLIVESLQVKVDSKKERKQQAVDWIEMKCPPVISSPNGSTTTGEKAYAVLHVREDTFDALQEATWKAYPLPLPAQYRDAAVLLYRSHFERNLLPFIQLNRWVTIVLYGGSGSSLPLDPMGFDAGCMRMFEPDWDAEEVQALIQEFAIWFRDALGREDLQEAWDNAKNRIVQHNRTRGSEKVLGRQKDWLQLFVTTLLLFCDYLKEISIAEGQRLEAECLYLLLPGSCSAPQTNLPLAEREIVPTRDCGDLLEAVIAALVKPAWSSALLYVPSRGNFDVEDPDRSGRPYMAYLRQHMDRYRKPDYIAMQIRVDSFCEAAPRLTGIRCDWRAVVSALRKAPPPYLREVKPAFMPADEVERAQRKTYTALTMDINRMAFLTDSERAYLRGRLLGKTDEQAWADVTAETVQPAQPDEAAPSKEPSSGEPRSEYDPEVWDRLREKDDAVENRILDQWDFLDFDF